MKGMSFKEFLTAYEDVDFVLYQKARILLVLCFALALVLVALSIAFILRGIDDLRLLMPPALVGIVLLLAVNWLRRGHFSLAAHTLLIAALAGVWVTMFVEPRPFMLSKYDTIVLVFGTLSLTPLIILRFRKTIALYFFANILLFMAFILHISADGVLPQAAVLEYAVDNSLTFFFMGIVAYQIFTIHANALRRAQEKEDSLCESTRRYRGIFENIQDVYFETSLEGVILEISPSVEQISQYRRSDLRGKPIQKLYRESQAGGNLIHRVLDQGRITLYDTDLIDNDGSHRSCSITASLVRDESGKALKVVGSLRDITEWKHSLTERKDLQEQLGRAQKMEALGLLAGGVAHDLNNVLSGIVGYPEMLLMDLPADSPLRKPLESINKSGQKAAAIVHDLLTLARRGVMDPTVITLNDVVRDYLDSPECEKLLSFHPLVTIETDLDSDLAHIKGSCVHLRKMLMNLVSNAAEAQPEGGRILISSYNLSTTAPLPGYQTVPPGNYSVLSVRDCGTGIDLTEIHRIFEPFYTKKVMGRSGTGLGMAVVWGTVQDHQGYIQVDSVPDCGSTFRLYFPSTAEAPAEIHKIPFEHYRGQREHILVIDDQPEQRLIASAMLERLGYTVTTMASGEEALVYLTDHSVDLVLLDMVMDPGLDGHATYRRVLELHPGQKALIVSGYSHSAQVNDTLELGAGGLIRKPYTLEQLGLALKSALSAPRSLA